MMKFGAFENTVEALYKYVVPKPKAQCSKGEQLGVSFAAGYIAGVFCAVVSHPADNLVSKLNSTPGASVGSIVGEMGWFQLFTRGLPLRIVMIGTLTGAQWGIYDAYKVYVGLPTTGGAPPPADTSNLSLDGAVDGAKDKAGDLTEQVKGKAQEVTDKAKGKAQEVADKAKGKAADAAGKVEEKAGDAKKELRK